MIYYENAGLYIESCTSIRAKITAINAIIDALMLSAAKAATRAHITEYSLNTGQTHIKTSLRGSKEVTAAIQEMEVLKQMYIARLPNNGRVSRIVDGKNLIY
jgi:hypothetical protein